MVSSGQSLEATKCQMNCDPQRIALVPWILGDFMFDGDILLGFVSSERQKQILSTNEVRQGQMTCRSPDSGQKSIALHPIICLSNHLSVKDF